MAVSPVVQAIVLGARKRGLDPQAVLAVAQQEGLSGRVGDQGTSFGPFQLHQGGAFPTGRVPAGQEQSWAMSPVGISYALDKIASVAKGLRAGPAVNAIVRRFERPANPGREVSRALSSYGGSVPNPQFDPGAGGARVSLSSGAGASGQNPGLPSGPDPRIMQALTATRSAVGLDAPGPGLLQALQQAPQPQVEGQPSPVGNAFGAGSDRALAIVKTAKTQLGQPYQWGGKAELGHPTDCSGLLQAAAAKHGINLPRVTYDQWKVGKHVAPGKIKPGDAVFFNMGPKGPEHVGIYIGNKQFLEDPHTGATVRISNLADHPGFVGARRYT